MTVRERQARIHKRVRKIVTGTTQRPRLNVFRSNKSIYVQLIDDVTGHTLASVSSKETGIKGTKIEQAAAVGKLVAQKSIEAGIKIVVFDRGGYLYHGRVKAIAEAAREGGLQF